MAKVSGYRMGIFWLAGALFLLGSTVSAQYRLQITSPDKDSVFLRQTLGLVGSFPGKPACNEYVSKLPALLMGKGYPAASVDSIHTDSLYTAISLYVGDPYTLSHLNVSPANRAILDRAGWNEKKIDNKPLDVDRVDQLKEDLLSYFEEHGYPFAKVQLDSFYFDQFKLAANLKVDRGPQYKIDSFHVSGAARISPAFLQRYLDIPAGSYYQKSKLRQINQRLLQLPYLQEKRSWDMTMLGSGSTLNLYLEPKKSSQVNLLVGFLPANQVANNSYDVVRTKLLFTGEATINLKNALGNGELIGVDWQQLQQSSPKLNLQYQQPYLFGSPFGIATSFDLYKKDSSYLNLNFQAGVLYAVSVNQGGRFFVQLLGTNLINVDTLALRATRKLPAAIDISTVNAGVEYNYNNTNYRLNPRRGVDLQFIGTAGIRNIRKNNAIRKLTDADFSYASLYDTLKLKTYQFSVKAAIANYLPLGRQSTLKTSFSGGWRQSPAIFRNELFQIGGYRLMRGFDEESIFASAYAVTTAEYRYLVGLNSYFFVFADGGFARNGSVQVQSQNSYLGVGLGMAFETKAGIFNISYALGKRNDLPFDFRQSKIHIGYLNYF